MPEVSKKEAVELLTKAVEEHLRADDLLEVYHELFPASPALEEKACVDVTPFVEQIVDHIQGKREIEEIVDLWNLVFPKDRDVWYDEENGAIHYNEESEPMHAE